MNRLLKWIFVFGVFMSLVSCAMHHGSVSSSVIDKSVRYEDMAIGVSQANKLFGLGGVSQDALIFEAKRKLTKNRPLNPNEQYNNFTIDIKTSFWPFYEQVKVTVGADVISILDENDSNIYSDLYLKKISCGDMSNDLFSIGDSIIIKKKINGTLISFEPNNKVRVAYQTKRQRLRTKKVSINKIYTKNKSYNGYNVGDDYIYILSSAKDGSATCLKVSAVGLKAFLIKDKISNAFIKVDYK